MAKTAIDVDSITRSYLQRLEQELDLERVLSLGELYHGIDGELSDIRFLVVSRTFEGMDHLARSEKLGFLGRTISPTVQAWAFTPKEIEQHLSGEKYDLFLAQFLSGSHEVYRKSSTKSPRKAAGG